MEAKTIENTAEEQSRKLPRVWRHHHLYFGTFLGGYVCGFYLLSENYKALGYPQLAKKAVLTGLVSTFIALALTFFLPLDSKPFAFLLILTTQSLLALGYLYYEHYMTICNWNRSKEVFIAFAIGLAALLTTPMYLSKQFMASIPRMMGPLLQIVFIDAFARLLQEEQIKELMKNGSKKNSFRRLLGITFLSLLVLLIFVSILLCVHLYIFPEL